MQNHGFASIGSLSESVGSQRFGTSYRYRDPQTGLLDGDVLPVDLAANAASLGADVLRARTVAELRDGLERARAADRYHRCARRDRPAGARPVVRAPGGTCRWPRSPRSTAPRQARAAYEAAKRGQRPYL